MQGEVSNYTRRNHWYFSLKDDRSVLNCVVWATTARRCRISPKDGDEVVAAGQISHYGPQGRTQLYVSEISPVGAGALERRFRELCEQLRALGYFDEARKKPLPLMPRRIAVVTSATGAAVDDVITTARQRCKAVGLLIVDVRVQGDGSAQDIARAIRWVDTHRTRLGVDAILITRGGGSMEDLWAFNERMVADAVWACRLPVVAAIGHESDTTIIELVADVRASTPTQAAMRLIPSAGELKRHVDHVARRVQTLVGQSLRVERKRIAQRAADLRRCVLILISSQRARLERLARAVAELRPQTQLAQRRARLAIALDRVHRAAAAQVHLRRQRIHGLVKHLQALDPHHVLQRGYSITSRPSGEVIRSAAGVARGEQIVTRLADGSIDSVVGDTRRRASRRPASEDRDQMDLFDRAR